MAKKIQFVEEVGGEAIGFRFGLLAQSFTEEISGVSINEIFQRIASGKNIQAMLFYYYGGIKAYNEYNGISKDLTIPMVSEIIEEIGEKKATEIYISSLAYFKTTLPEQKPEGSNSN